MKGVKFVSVLFDAENTKYYFEFPESNINNLLIRKNCNGAQKAFLHVLKEISHGYDITDDRINEISEKLQQELEDTSFKVEYIANNVETTISIYNWHKKEMQFFAARRKDMLLLKSRFGLSQEALDSMLEASYHSTEYFYDCVNVLERKDGFDFFDGDAVIAKSLIMDSKIKCFDNSSKIEKINGFLQMVIENEAMNLKDLQEHKIKRFIHNHLRKIYFPLDQKYYWKDGGTIFQEFPLQQQEYMTKDLVKYGILDDNTKVENAFLIIPNFETNAIKNKKVKFEFGLHVQIGPKTEEDQFFVPQ